MPAIVSEVSDQRDSIGGSGPLCQSCTDERDSDQKSRAWGNPNFTHDNSPPSQHQCWFAWPDLDPQGWKSYDLVYKIANPFRPGLEAHWQVSGTSDVGDIALERRDLGSYRSTRGAAPPSAPVATPAILRQSLPATCRPISASCRATGVPTSSLSASAIRSLVR